MGDQTQNQVQQPEEAGGQGQSTVRLYKGFNYVGTKETAAYLMNDWSNAFNIDSFKERYIWDVVHVDFTVQAVVNIVTTIWDVVNDAFASIIVDGTRTRIGKFRPYLVAMQIPLTILGLLYWLLPALFGGTSGTYVPKLIFYFIFNIISETAGTFKDIAKGGYMSTITPNPNERIRLITLAELLTGMLGEDLPRYLMGIIIDLINNKVITWKLSSAFMTMGVATGLISCAFTFWFFLTSKERVPQSLERPNIKEGLKAIVTNYPVLLMCASDFLSGFRISKGETNYFMDVFGSYSYITLYNLPSGPVGSVSYAFVSPLRKRFSSKALWIFGNAYSDLLLIGVFLFGMSRKRTMMFQLVPMCIAFGLKEFMEKWSWGVKKVINADLWNEAMDYCEWKNGYRMEATTSVAKGLILKIQGGFMGSITNLLMKRIGYMQGLEIGTQSDTTKFWVFAMCTVVPALTGALGIIPKFLWPISQAKRKQMYDELAVMRQNRVMGYMEDFESEQAEA